VRVEVPVDPQVYRRIQDGVSLGDLGFGGFSLFLGGSRLRGRSRQWRRTAHHGQRFPED